MIRRVTLAPWMRAAVRLLAGVALAFFAVGLVVHTQGLTPPQASIQGRLEPVTTAQQALAVPADDVGDFYLYQGRRIPLHRSQDALGVRFRPTLAREALAANLHSLVPAASIQAPGTPGTQGVSIVIIPSPKAADATRLALSPQLQLDQAREALKASPTVEFVFPVFINPGTGTRLLVSDEIVAKLRSGIAPSTVTGRFALTVVEPLWKTTDEYVFRLVDPKATDPLAVANAMAASDLVEWAEPNFIQEYRKWAVPNDPLFPNQWHLNNTGQTGGTVGADAHLPGAWDLTTGSSSIVVAIIDDGVEMTHEDLAANIFTNPGEIPGNGIDDDGNGKIDDVHGWDFSNNDNDPSPMSTSDNHGTSVAGVAAGRGNNGVGVTGACQNCRILPVKVFSPNFVSNTVAGNAIRYAASLADVLNNSWGGGSASSEIQSAIQWATTNGRGGKGSVVLFASGNSASGFMTFTLSGFPAGTHGFRWTYSKDSTVSSGEDSAWLGWVELPGGERVTFESGIPADWTTGGDANWGVDSTHVDEGWCLTKAARAGAITHSQSTNLAVVKPVPAGNLRYTAWVSSESGFDKFKLEYSLNNTGSWTEVTSFTRSGVPAPTTAVSYPAAYPESIAVGASTDFDCRAEYSQYGSALAFVAPSSGGGAGITTTDRTGSAGYDSTSNYTSTFGGTSSATPLASGIAGLLLSRNGTLTVSQVRQALQNTADKIGAVAYTDGRNDRYGFGRLNAAAALAGVPRVCAYTIAPTSTIALAPGGSGSVAVATNSDCEWTAVSNDGWITVTGGASGTGPGSVGYSVAANAGATRTGTVTIADKTFTVTQAGASCTYALNPINASLAAGGGTGSVGVTADAGCPWTAVSNDGWITVTGGASGTGNGTVSYSVAANTGPARSGTVTIGGQTFTVNQASGCVYAIAPTSAVVSVAGGIGSVGVTTTSVCGWTAVSNDAWITVTGDSSGTGNGTVNYSVAANAGATRTGTITISGRTFTVTQAGTSCTYSLTPVSRTTGGGATTGSVSVTADAGCPWAAVSNDAWLTVTGGATGSGNGTVSYSAAAGGPRSGTITIGWQTFTLTQSANQFTDISAGLQGLYRSAVAWGDYDNDGDLDALVTGCTFSAANVCNFLYTKLYRNDGSGVFTNTGASLTAMRDASIAWGDYDRDGYVDLAVNGCDHSGISPVNGNDVCWTVSTRIYRNNGNGTFTDIGASLPGSSASVAWGDYDNDGDVDLLVGSRLYRNDGGTFVEVTTGLPTTVTSSSAWGDYDNDGKLDILLVGGPTWSSYLARVYHNDGGGVFTDISAGLTAASGSVGGSAVWGDYDNDGDLDILYAGYTGTAYVTKLYRNDGSGLFTEVAAGLPGTGGTVAWGDYDNDGRLDILLAGATKILHNDGGGVLTDIGEPLASGSSTAVWGDYDNDGKLDILVSGSLSTKIYHSGTGTANTVPAAPGGLSATVLGGRATLNWDAASDTQTPAAGLGYNIRVGSSSGGANTVSPMASVSTGYRRIVGLGNAGPRRSLAIGGLAEGTYYWSVQAIDTALAGSPFATEGSFFVCGTSIDPTSQAVAAGGGTGAVSVTAVEGCAWTAVSNAAWITVTGGASGTGNGSVGYSVAANIGAARSGTITIGTQTFTVNQASGCIYMLNPTSASFGPAAGTGTVGVTTLAGCPWTAVSNDAWITVTGGASGTGNGTINYSVAANTGASRNGSITIGGQTFGVAQAASLFTEISAGLTGVYTGPVAWGDYDNDGDLDILYAGYTGGSTRATKLYRNDGGGVFTEVSTSLVGITHGSLAWGDCDNDGDLDILMVGLSASGKVAKVYRNDGGGVFTDISAALTGVSDSAAAWGDYDNDGDLDILLAGSSSSGDVTKVYRNDGGGVFTDIGASLVGVEQCAVAWGDYDNDGDLDILVAGYAGSTAVTKVYRNNGGGTFTDIGAGLLGQVRGSVAWGDYDNDGDLDILVAGDNGSTYLAKLYRNDGGGLFTDIGAALRGVSHGTAAWGDFDNDGDLDILLVGWSGSSSRISTVYRNDGAGVFTDLAENLLAVGNSAAAWGDYDNDGRLDILLIGYADSPYNAKLYRSTVATANTTPGTPAGLSAVGGANQATLDWTASSDGQTPQAGLVYNVRLGTSPGGIEKVPPMASPDTGFRRVVSGGNAGARTTAVIKGLPGGTYYWSVQAIDTAFAGSAFASEGTVTVCGYAIDPASANPAAGGASGSVSVTAGAGCGWTAVSNAAWITVDSGASGTGNGSVGYTVAANTGPARSATITIGSQTFTVNQASGCTYAINPTSVNVTGSGGSGSVNVTTVAGCGWTAVSNDAWITVTSGASGSGNGSVGYSVAANAGAPRSGTITIAGQTFTVAQGEKGFTDVGAGLTGVTFSAVAWGDYDNDGDLDILLTGDTDSGYISKVYRNDGGGVFTDIGAGLAAVAFGSVAWGDYDNDGDLDILLAGWTGSTSVTKVYRNDGGGVFTDTGAALPGFSFGSVAWGDYDNDGDLDILFAGSPSKVYRNDGGGVFTDIGATLVNVFPGTGAWGDYDHDGDLDILLAGHTSSGNVTKLYRNDGSGVFTDIGAALVGITHGSVAWGDYDNDGDLDILLAGDTGSSYIAKVYRNDGGGVFTDIGAGLTGVYYAWAAWGDYDNDGRLDILLSGAYGAGYVTKVYRNDGAGTFTDAGQTLSQVGFGCAAWGDYDNDGRLDILLTGSPTTSKVYRNTISTANTAPAAPTGLGAVPGSGQVTLNWTASSDTQTPQGGLSYNVRVGTTSGGVEKVPPMASPASGYRRVAQFGNAGERTSAVVKGLAAGTYYWSVQAIDTAFAGSPFASEGTFTVCGYTIDPTSASPAAGGGSGSVAVTTGAGCGWTAVSNAGWITVDSGASGTGNGTVGYSVAANTGGARSGTITIAGQTFSVNQASGGRGLPTFTDDPLVAHTTPVKAVHIAELRAAIASLRARYSLGACSWTDPTLVAGTTPVKAAHLTELRAALSQVYIAAGRTPPTYAAPNITAGSTVITATHIAELRAAVLAIW